MSSADVLHGLLMDISSSFDNRVVYDSSPPPKRRRTDLMDMKELAEFLREEVNLLTGKPPWLSL